MLVKSKQPGAFLRNRILLSGRALYLAIVIAFITSVLAFLFLLSRYYSYIEINTLKKQQELTDNVESALHLILQKPELIPFNEEQQLDIFNDGSRICKVQKKHWGLYQHAWAESGWKQLKYQRLALFGERIAGEGAKGLYLADHGHYLAVAGDTYLSGDCYLPKLGVRKAYIDGKSFKYRDIVHGKTYTSQEKLPLLLEDWVKYVETELFVTANDSMADENYLYTKNLNRSFRIKTVRVYNENEIVLSGINVSGNCIVQSAKKIFIRKDAEIENVICVAPIIEVEEDFKGTVQLFALDSILLQDNVTLQYPSALVVSGFGRSSVYTAIPSGCNISGSVVLFTDSEEGTDVTLIIDENVVINGQVYCAGKVSHKGVVNGSLYCDKLFLQTRQGYYENHLLDAKIDPLSLEPSFASGIILNEKTGTSNQVILWLN